MTAVAIPPLISSVISVSLDSIPDKKVMDAKAVVWDNTKTNKKKKKGKQKTDFLYILFKIFILNTLNN